MPELVMITIIFSSAIHLMTFNHCLKRRPILEQMAVSCLCIPTGSCKTVTLFNFLILKKSSTLCFQLPLKKKKG